ncbi:MAG: ATP-binding cassette domain-containing protein [Candidatus Tyrphobacter sp.]
MSAALIRFESVTKRYGAHLALEDVTLDVFPGELLVLIGRSGSGKTTLLRTVNGLVTPDAGSVVVGGTDVAGCTDITALRRGIGYVIQSGGLFSHMTVAQNVAIIGRARNDPRPQRMARARVVLEQVGLEGFQERHPRELSGGQLQRVGIARALYADPPIMLLDEPFAAVDPILRMDLQDSFATLHRELRKTMMFVTHDVEEALYLGDRVAVFDDGRIVQVDTPRALRENPASEYIARFLRRRTPA